MLHSASSRPVARGGDSRGGGGHSLHTCHKAEDQNACDGLKTYLLPGCESRCMKKDGCFKEKREKERERDTRRSRKEGKTPRSNSEQSKGRAVHLTSASLPPLPTIYKKKKKMLLVDCCRPC